MCLLHLANPTFTGPTAAAVASSAAAASAAAAPTACMTVSAGWRVTICGCGEPSVSNLAEGKQIVVKIDHDMSFGGMIAGTESAR